MCCTVLYIGRFINGPLLSSIEYGHIYSPAKLFDVDVVGDAVARLKNDIFWSIWMYMGRFINSPLRSSIEYGHIYSPGELFPVDVVGNAVARLIFLKILKYLSVFLRLFTNGLLLCWCVVLLYSRNGDENPVRMFESGQWVKYNQKYEYKYTSKFDLGSEEMTTTSTGKSFPGE